MEKNNSILTKVFFICFFVSFVNFSAFSQTIPYQNDYALGLDLSFVKQSEDRGTKYYDEDGTEKPVLQIFRQHGFNWSRIMICNEPTNRLPQDLEYVVEAASAAKEYNYFFLLDMMFSNGWANPMNQPTPSLWVDMSHPERVEAVYEYVHKVVSRLKSEGLTPDMIQIGNEIGNGFLWPDGRINYAKPEESKWEHVADYLKAGVRAIRALKDGKKIKIMLHVDHGGDLEMTQTFFDNMNKYNVDYDVVGLSFYPWSHGTLIDLKDNLKMTALRFKKEIIVVETGYYYSEGNYFKDQKPPFPETPEGQKAWFEAVNEAVLDTPNGLGRGVFWWHPLFRTRGFFDTETNVAKPIVGAVEKYGLPIKRADGQKRIQ